MQHAAPRHFTPNADLLACPPTSDRAARIADRRGFVALKQTYLAAMSEVPDTEAEWLRNQVRLAEQPVDLWLLRAPVFAALAGADPERRRRRQMLRRGLDSVFMDSEPTSSFMLL